MVTRIGKGRKNTRSKLKQHYRKKGKISLSKYFQKLKTGDKVALVATPNVIKGMYFLRFHGRVATVVNKRGFCYQVSLVDGRKEKRFNVHPIHLKKL